MRIEAEESEGFEYHLRVKKESEAYLTSTSLDWVIVRPGHLLDNSGDRLVRAGLALQDKDIRRDNLLSSSQLPLTSRSSSGDCRSQ